MKKEKVKPEDIQKLRFLEKISVSPDEKYLIISVKEIKKYKYKENIYLHNIREGKTIALTSQDSNDKFICWSPDSESIFFSSNREKDDKSALYSIRINGGEPGKIIDLDDISILEFKWLDERKAVLICQKDEIQGIRHNKDIVYYEFDKPVYKMDGKGYYPKDFPQFYILDIEEKKLKILKTSNRPKSNLIIDKDSGNCYFITNLSRDIYARAHYNDIVYFNIDEKKIIRTDTEKGPKSSFDISPDKNTLAVISHFYPDEFSGARKYDLIIYNIKDGKYINASSEIINSAQINTISDMEQTGWFKNPIYSKDSSCVFFNVSENASNRIYRYSFKDNESLAITDTSYNVIDYDISREFIYAVLSFPSKPSELYRIDLKDYSKKKLTSFNQAFIDEKSISEPAQYSVMNKDGFDVDYWLIKPPEFNKNEKYPLILNIHGGPHAQFANTFFFELQVMASAGYVILYSNPTGSMGKGYDFAKKLENNWGRPDSEDISIIMERVKQLDFIDNKRIGVTGGSYGGFMTNWLLGTTDYFKTGITERCVSSLIGMAENSDFSYFTPRQFKGYFWRNLDKYWDMSPIRFVDNIKAPLLIVHSDNDNRTPLNQAEGLYTAMKILRKKAKLVIFPKESHGLNRGGDPLRRIERLKLFIRWFDKYLK